MAVLDSTRVQQDNSTQRSAVLHRQLHHDFPSLARGEGHYLILDNGHRIFDASGGAAVACVGVRKHLSLLDCPSDELTMEYSMAMPLSTELWSNRLAKQAIVPQLSSQLLY